MTKTWSKNWNGFLYDWIWAFPLLPRFPSLVSLSLSLFIYTYVYICVCVCIYVVRVWRPVFGSARSKKLTMWYIWLRFYYENSMVVGRIWANPTRFFTPIHVFWVYIWCNFRISSLCSFSCSRSSYIDIWLVDFLFLCP